LELDRVKPLSTSVAVKVAHVPVVYQVPLLMMHPFLTPLTMTLRLPLPLKGVPGAAVDVGAGPPTVVVVEGGDELAFLGMYLIPV
jgi:hypothetical protein